MNFDTAFHKLLGHEGAYSDHPSDPGGRTMWGVTERVARADGYQGHMRDFPVDHAKRIYRRQYWDAVRAEELPPLIRYAVFDAAVNSGVRQAVRWLQRAVGARDDGVIGPETLMMARAANPDFAARRMLGMRLEFMASLSNWPAFSRGWARRIADLLQA
jgi:lysozyme family protein